MKKVCVVTGTRAEYGLLKPVIEKIGGLESFELQLVVTGMHLSTEFGMTYQEIEKDGLKITYKIEMLLSSDTSTGITKSMGIELIGFADYISQYKPDIFLILGDRYEMFIAATAAMMARIPIAHIHGGELTEGVVDEAIRHAITKMSHIHFTSTEEYRKRVIQLGEQPESVFNVGALGVENIKSIRLLDLDELEEEINFKFGKKTIMVTYHPVTLENCTADRQFENILNVLDKHKDCKVIFTKANSDMNGRIINKMIDCYVSENRNNCIAFTSMGQLRYLSALKYCDVVLGNSSSGIIEAPSVATPTINIGDRQKGRVSANSVIHCGYEINDIEKSLYVALSYNMEKLNVKNPYECDNTSKRIVDIIKGYLDRGITLNKIFYDIER